MTQTKRTDPDAHEKIAFVTGRLASGPLRRLLERVGPELGLRWEVIELAISVAALMTPAFVTRRLRGPVDADRMLLPGYCAGDLESVRAVAGVPVERGPKDLRALPRWLRGETAREPGTAPEGYGAYAIEIIAEINHAPDLDAGSIRDAARRYRASGADVIDVGCNPGSTWTGIGDVVRMLRDEGHRVAIDTFDVEEIRRGVAAGAELVLSVHGDNLEVARDLGCEVVAIPDDPRTLGGLDETVGRLREWGVPHRIDPIIEPIGIGLAASLSRYVEVRRRYPDTAILMGIGNLTELTDVDSAGVNALLIGFCEELHIGSVLTTEVINWARGSVREIDIARRLMHHAVSEGIPPKNIVSDLICRADPEILEQGQEALDELARSVRDPNFRIFAERGEIHCISRDVYARDADPFELFDRLDVGDPSHAFYLGYEMAKALIALQLGKQYRQDEALRWGYLTIEEKSHYDRRHPEARGRARERGDPGEAGDTEADDGG